MSRRRTGAGGELLEAAWQAQVVGLAGFYGWRHYHTADSRRSAPGFPDLVLVRGPELIFAELKRERGRATLEQREWLAALEEVAAGVRRLVEDAALGPQAPRLGGPRPAVEVHLWRPSDFDAVHARLARGRHRQPASWEA